ncbi:MAG TPA: efflux RND transporter periplasmic adaptor subunit [Candidatus Acidoferrum sp.]
MNLTRVLNNALPEIPARTFSDRPPRIPPDLVFKEHLEDGKPVIRVVVSGQEALYKFPRANWDLIQLFNGQRSFEEIAKAYSEHSGYRCSVEEIREFTDSLEALDFWYKTPQEKNVQLMQKTSDERKKLLKSRKSRFGDLSEIAFPAVNPDRFVTWLYKYSSWIYTWWFTVVTLIAFAVSIGITVANWGEIGRDTVEFFSFSHKSWGDVAVFYVLALLTLSWHELGHAHTCKHYGGRVPAMGFLLIYLTPAFFTDTSEGFVKGGRYERFTIAMAGAWSELYIWAIATPIWWGTEPGSSVHNVAYLLMLMSGIASLFLNWNPLMKLDGYFMLSEIVGISDLKENSTAYVSAWVKKHIWRLPIEVPYVPKKRRLPFAVYAILSGAYSYTVLYVVARFVGNVFRNFNPEWSFVPELGTATLIFRSRIRSLVNFMKFVYLDKKDRIRAWAASRKGIALALAALIFLLLPIWHESADARFVLEPLQTAIIRNLMPGTVTQVYVTEGAAVRAGEPLLQLKDLGLESKVAEGEASYAMATMRANAAAVRYANLGTALEEREQMSKQRSELRTQAESLEVNSPIAGTVLTSRLEDRLNVYAQAGTELAEVADLRQMRARAYVSEHDMNKVGLDAPARLNVRGFAKLWDTEVLSIRPASSQIDSRLAEDEQFKGLDVVNFYAVDLVVDNPEGKLRPGMTGIVRIYSGRTSILGHLGREVLRFSGRKIW